MTQDSIKFSNSKRYGDPNQALDMTALKNSAKVMETKELANILNLTPQGRALKNMADSKTRWNLMTKLSFGQRVDKKASENLRKRVLISFAKNDWSWLPAVVQVNSIGNNIKKSASINMDKPQGRSILLNSHLKGSELSNYFFQEIGTFFAQSLHTSAATPSNRGLRLAAYLKNRMAVPPDPKPTGHMARDNFPPNTISEFYKKEAKVTTAAELETLSAAQINRLTGLPQMAVAQYLELQGNRSGARRIQDTLACNVLKVAAPPCRGGNPDDSAAVEDLLSRYYAMDSDWFAKFTSAETNYENPEVHLRPSVIGRHKGIAHDAYIISGYSGTTRYRDKAVIAGTVYGKALAVVSDSEAMESLALTMADLVRHRIQTAGSDVDALPQSLLDAVKDKTWSVIEVECQKEHYTGIKLLDRKNIDTIGNAIEEALRTWWQTWKATSARFKEDVGTPNPCNACKKMETELVEDAARTVTQILDKQYRSAAHPITDPSLIDRPQPGQIVQAFEDHNTAVSPSVLLEVVSECYRKIGGLVTFEGLDGMLAAGRYDDDKLSAMDRAAFDDMARAFALNDNYNQTTTEQKRERFVRALCWDLGYIQTAPRLPEKRDNPPSAVADGLQGRASGQMTDAEPQRPYPTPVPGQARTENSDTPVAQRVTALRAFVNAGLQMINDYLGSSDTRDLEAYGNIIERFTVGDAIAYMSNLHDRDRRVAVMNEFSSKLQKAIEKASETPRTYTESGDLSRDSQNADFISRLTAAYHVLRRQPADADTMTGNRTALHHLLSAAGVGASALSAHCEVAGDHRSRKKSHPPVETQPAVTDNPSKAPDGVQNPSLDGSPLGRELVRLVARGLQSALKAADIGSVIRMAMATAATSAPAAQVAAATNKIGGILARGASALRKLMRGSFVEEALDDACHLTELVRIAKIGYGPSSGGGTGGDGRDPGSNGADASGSDTVPKGNANASAETVARRPIMPFRTGDAFFNGTKVGRIKWEPTQLDEFGQVSLPTVSVDIGKTRQRFFIMAGNSPTRARSGAYIFVRQTEPGKNGFIPVDPTTGRDLEHKKVMIYLIGAKKR